MEIFEVLPIVSLRGRSTGIPIFAPKWIKKSAKLLPPDFLLCSGGNFAILFNVDQKADFLLLADSRGLFASGRRSSTGENKQSDESGKQRIEPPRGMRG
jgi:hypothetical protein